MIPINQSILLKVSFPVCLVGSNSVYYTIYNADGTVYLSRRNTGVINFLQGNYGVELSFTDVGGYLIVWDIDSTSYTASEELNTYDLNSMQEKIQAIYDIEYGKWKIDPDSFQMIFYRENSTEIARFNLKDILGNPAYINVFEREKVI